MKYFLLKALRYLLKRLAQLTIWRFRPGIIGVTGSVGKTSAKLAIAAVLGGDRKVRAAAGNLNNDLGLPLTILGDWSEAEIELVSRGVPAGEKHREKILFWLKVLAVSVWQVLFGKRADYPEILILEYSADRPGDIRHLLSIARPNVSVVTAIGEVPVHVEFFSGPAELTREKARLIECLPVAGYAVLGADDPLVMNLRDRTRAHVTSYGFHKSAGVRIVNFEHKLENGRPTGIAFKLDYGGGLVPVRLTGTLGRPQAAAAAAATSVGLIFGLNLVKISEALARYVPAKSRMQLRTGIKDTLLIDDTYNASPASTEAALLTLKGLGSARKVAVLGDMLELGAYATEAHRTIGALAGKAADVLVAVGPRAKFIIEGARAAGLDKGKVHWFETAADAASAAGKFIQKGDIVLLKASRAMHLEEVVATLAKV